jgi:hypothetical protein
VPLSEISGPANKVLRVEGFPLDMSENVIFVSGDSSSKSGFLFIADGNSMPAMPPLPPLEPRKTGAPRIIINGKEVSPSEMDKIDPSSIKTIDIRNPQQTPRIVINGKVVSPDEIGAIDPSSIKTINIRGNEKGVAVAGNNMERMTWVESTGGDGKKIVTVKVDSAYFDGTSKEEKAPTKDNFIFIEALVDSPAVKTATGQKIKSDVSAIILKASDDKVGEKIENDSKTLTFASTDKEGKKTYTFVQKTTEKTELPKDVLYIIDGKEMQSGSIKDVDPGSIKMVSVLKGEAAVKKYGEKAKNGVVEITTKK